MVKQLPMHKTPKPFNGKPRMATVVKPTPSLTKLTLDNSATNQPELVNHVVNRGKTPTSQPMNVAVPSVNVSSPVNKKQGQHSVNEVETEGVSARKRKLVNEMRKLQEQLDILEPKKAGFWLSDRINEIPQPGPSPKSDLVTKLVQSKKPRISLMGVKDKPIEIEIDAVKARTKKVAVRKLDKVPASVSNYRNVKAGILDEDEPLENQHIDFEKLFQYNCSNPLKFTSSLCQAMINQNDSLKKLANSVSNEMAEVKGLTSFRELKPDNSLNLPARFEHFQRTAGIKQYKFHELKSFEAWQMKLPEGTNKNAVYNRIKAIRSEYRSMKKVLNVNRN